MFAAAIPQSSSSFSSLTFGWFDFILLLTLAFGLWRGRKRGMSRELLPLLMWLGIIFTGAFGYPLLGDELAQTGYVRKIFGNQFLERTAANISAYLLLAFSVWLIFYFLKNLFKAKVEAATTFGNGEYYLGMISGLVRYACMLFFVLALLNAPFYSVAEQQARAAYNKQWFGGGVYDGNYLPDVPTVQSAVFKRSFCGKLIKQNLSLLLIDNANGGASKPVKH